jgi:inositol hexakisphosphate/diphosphoinositol-pentakisphosphate kinase
MLVKALADVVIPQEYGLSDQDKLAIGQGICNPLMRKIRADLQRNIEEDLPMSDESVNRLDPRYKCHCKQFKLLNVYIIHGVSFL